MGDARSYINAGAVRDKQLAYVKSSVWTEAMVESTVLWNRRINSEGYLRHFASFLRGFVCGFVCG